MANYKSVLHDLYYNVDSSISFGSLAAIFHKLKSLEGFEKITKHQVKDWLEQQKVYTLHSKVSHKFLRSKVISYGLDYLWEADIAYAPAKSAHLNKGFKYILVVIDGLSQYLLTRSLKNKTGVEVAEALLDILKTSGRSCQLLVTDSGGEFISKEVRNTVFEPYSIHHIIASGKIKAGIAENAIKLVKRKLYRFMTYTGSKVWLDKLQQFTKSLNSRFIKTLGTSPNQVNAENVVNIFK